MVSRHIVDSSEDRFLKRHDKGEQVVVPQKEIYRRLVSPVPLFIHGFNQRAGLLQRYQDSSSSLVPLSRMGAPNGLRAFAADSIKVVARLRAASLSITMTGLGSAQSRML